MQRDLSIQSTQNLGSDVPPSLSKFIHGTLERGLKDCGGLES